MKHGDIKRDRDKNIVCLGQPVNSKPTISVSYIDHKTKEDNTTQIQGNTFKSSFNIFDRNI